MNAQPARNWLAGAQVNASVPGEKQIPASPDTTDDEYDNFLLGIADVDRREAVMAWLGSDLEPCAAEGCGHPVRVMDGHVATKAGLMHRECAPTDG